MYQDETLSCVDCAQPFTFTSGEQSFYAEKGFANKPNRCPDCRAARKAQRNSGGGGGMGGGRRRGGYPGGGGRTTPASSKPQGKEFKVTVTDQTSIKDNVTTIGFDLLRVGDRISIQGLPKGKGDDLQATQITVSQ